MGTLRFFLLVLIYHLLTNTFINSKAWGQNKAPLTYSQIRVELLRGDKKVCAELKNQIHKTMSPIKPVMQLRYFEHCEAKPNWEEFYNQNKESYLSDSILKSWFNNSVQRKAWAEAFHLYKNHNKSLKLRDKEFEDFAIATLKTKLSSKDKKFLQNTLYKKSPRFLPHPTEKDFMKVAKDFRDARDFAKALFFYRKLINNPKQSDKARWQAYRGARMTYKIERWTQMEKYILASKQWSQFLRSRYRKSTEHLKMHHDANIEYVRTLWTERGQQQALPILVQLEKELQGRYSLQMVYWLRGRMAEENKNYTEAVDWLLKASNEKKIGHEDWQRVLWSLAWNQRRVQNYKDSEATMDTLLKDPELTAFAKAKYLYWKAENELSQNNQSAAESAFEKVIDFDTHGYYGALAYRRLKRSMSVGVKLPLLNEMDLLSSELRPTLEALVEAREFEYSEALVTHAVQTSKTWSDDQWIQYLLLLQHAGAFKKSFIKYHQLKPSLQVRVLKDYPGILFPQPFPKIVNEAEQQSKVSAALIYSIMKQESGFDVYARSHADAFGLLQLIPQVAIKAAQRLPAVDYKKPEDLYRPEVIIALGANNLQHLLERFQSNFILSVAAYNASEQAVKGWIQTRYNSDPVTFIEDIPYEETKGYIKLVMRNYIAYHRLYYSEAPIDFPESCLADLAPFKK